MTGYEERQRRGTPEARRLAGVQLCLYGFHPDRPDRYCGEPAVVHVWIQGEFNTQTCEAHRSWWDSHPHKDQHPIGPPCGLPGATWRFSTSDSPGWCEIDGLSVSELVGFDEALDTEKTTAGAHR